MSNNEIKKYDENNNLIHHKRFDEYGFFFEIWYEYDENNNRIYVKGSDGWECWAEYDENNNEIYYKNTDGAENWVKYDNENNRIIITKQEFENIKIKEYLSRTKCSRFELMEI